MFKERTFDTGALTINYVEGPLSGPPMVLLHGGGDRWQYLLPILPCLATRWHVFALDLRGHGKSDRMPGQYRPEHYVADVVAFMDSEFTQPAILLGHSLGGWIALLTAAQQQDKVRALILGDPPLNIDHFLAVESTEERQGMWRTLRRLAAAGLTVTELAASLGDLPVTVPDQDEPAQLRDLPGMDDVALQAWAKTLSQVDPDAAQYHAEGRLAEYVENVNPDAALQCISCPVLLLQGDPSHGGVISDSDAQHVLSLLANGLHVKLEGAGHDLGLGTWQVAPLLRALTGFLESL